MISHVVSPAPRHEWNEVASADPDLVVEQTAIWLDALVAAGGFQDASRLYRFADGRRFVLPLVAKNRFGSTVFGSRHGFASGWGIGGIVGAELDAGVVSAIVADLATERTLYTHLRPNPLQHQAWADAEIGSAKLIRKRAHVVDLAGGIDETQSRFGRSGRRGIRKSERAGVEVTTHLGGESLEEYYRSLYLPAIARWAERQREPLVLARLRSRQSEPLEKLQTIAAALGDSFRLYLARVNGEPACGNIVVAGPHNSHATRGAMNYGLATTSRAGYAAEWAAIQDACQAGHRWYQMGESGENQSLSEYKERFGARAIDYHEVRIERFPLLEIDQGARSIVKRAIGFRDT